MSLYITVMRTIDLAKVQDRIPVFYPVNNKE